MKDKDSDVSNISDEFVTSFMEGKVTFFGSEDIRDVEDYIRFTLSLLSRLDTFVKKIEKNYSLEDEGLLNKISADDLKEAIFIFNSLRAQSLCLDDLRKYIDSYWEQWPIYYRNRIVFLLGDIVCMLPIEHGLFITRLKAFRSIQELYQSCESSFRQAILAFRPIRQKLSLGVQNQAGGD